MDVSIDFRPVGFNLGGWLSQSDLSEDHVKNFITAEDFRRIARWGFNSIRLPVDAQWLFEDQGRGSLAKDRLKILKKVLDWSADAGLLTILDMHQVPWHSFAKPELENLWKNDEDLNSFCRLWAELASELKGTEGPLWFDTLNEPTAKDPGDWNKVAQRVYEAIRSVDPQRVILLESTSWASVARLGDLVERARGHHLVYSFHFYLPMFVTHQGAPWWKDGKAYQEEVHYPGGLPRVDEYLSKELSAPTRAALMEEGSQIWDREGLKVVLKPVERYTKEGFRFYCGEFGVYDKAPRTTRLNWTRDVVGLFKEMGIGWAYWNYKWLDFGVYSKRPDGSTGPEDKEMVTVLQGGC
jgi:endoglucanase